MGRKRKRHRNLPQNMRISRGAYYLTAYVDGRQKWLPLGKDPSRAFAEYARLTAYEHPAGKTVADAWARYEREDLPKLKPTSRKAYRSWARPLLKTFGHIPVASLRQPHAAQFLDTYPYKVTANRVVAVLKSVLRRAKRWGWVETNVLEGLEQNEEKRRTRIISDAEWRAILAAADPDMRRLLRLARFTALRQADICGLRWGDVKGDRLVVITGKSEAPVSFQIAGELAEVLAEIKGTVSPFPKVPLFPGREGKPLAVTTLQDRWARARDAAQVVGVVFHDIRRTRITELAERYGRDFAQKVAAHADAKMTDRYTISEAVLVDWPSSEIRGGKEANAAK